MTVRGTTEVPASEVRVNEVPVRHRGGPPPQDSALYSCACGFVFDALVSTSVRCEHCGRTQAW